MRRRIAGALIRALARWGGIKPCEHTTTPQMAVWDDLNEFAAFRPAWPLIVKSDVWRKELEPWLKRLLLETDAKLRVEPDADMVRRYQVRALLLDGLLQQPQIEIARMQAQIDNLYASGEEPIPMGVR